MKNRLHLIILLSMLTALGAVAQTVGEAFYIYRNDGQFNAFFRDEVLSMEYSYEDVDGTLHDEIVTQVVNTADSVYRIPLAAIDSVGFVQPQTVYKQGITRLEGTILDYIVKVEGAFIYFLPTTPDNVLPVVGDRLVTLEMTGLFPGGFAGEVVSVVNNDENVTVECSTLDLEDVLDSYGYTLDMETADSQEAHMVSRSGSIKTRYFDLPTLSHSWELGAGYAAFSVDGTIEASLTPKLTVRGTDIVDPVRGRLTDIRVTGNYSKTVKNSYSLSASKTWEVAFPGGKGERFIAPLLSFFWDFGMFAEVSGSVTYSQTFTHNYVSHLDYKREGNSMPYIALDRPSLVGVESSEAQVAISGTLQAGFYGEIGIKPWILDKDSDIGGKVSGRLEAGVEISMEQGIDVSELEDSDNSTSLYDRVDGSTPSITVGGYASADITVKAWKWNTHWTPWKGSIGRPIFEGAFFPHFSGTAYEYTGTTGSIRFSSDLSRSCLFGQQIGFSVFDADGRYIMTEYNADKYRSENDMRQYEVTIGGLQEDVEYKVYPSVNLFGHLVLASPAVTVKPCPVRLSDFQITNAQYERGAFSNDGMTYDYRFDVSVTATLSGNTDNVADWGYVYLDPNGREREISLKQFGISYTDTRYAYFRNSAKSVATLYGYVKYVDSGETVYGPHTDFDLEYAETTCPDSHHPHLIDLGLPSGTKWTCCNVGATAPEGYGGYYAWGETSEKSVYNRDTYQYYNSNTGNLIDIGSDIAGTQYDVAHVSWGGSWRMPTIAQIMELLNNTTSTWTTVNGVYGRKFTGTDGACVFLPAAGYRWDENLIGAGSDGDYWSSSLCESNGAYYLRFYSGYAGWYYDGRYFGHTVRPVCP